LTDCRTKSAQLRWLIENRWRFATSNSGRPRVAREYWRMRMVDGPKANRPAIEPDFSGLREHAA
jgi:hypothetical protein